MMLTLFARQCRIWGFVVRVIGFSVLKVLGCRFQMGGGGDGGGGVGGILEGRLDHLSGNQGLLT